MEKWSTEGKIVRVVVHQVLYPRPSSADKQWVFPSFLLLVKPAIADCTAQVVAVY